MRWLLLLVFVGSFALSLSIQASHSANPAGAVNASALAAMLNLIGWAALILFVVSLFQRKKKGAATTTNTPVNPA
ncbi:MAG: hypothetical protein JSS00_12540 [Proteobacteria bacterium]|nr:hypothetical protein [Pseudomonadota bacterium]